MAVFGDSHLAVFGNQESEICENLSRLSKARAREHGRRGLVRNKDQLTFFRTELERGDSLTRELSGGHSQVSEEDPFKNELGDEVPY